MLKQYFMIDIRKKSYYIYRGARCLFKLLTRNSCKPIRNITYYPCVRDKKLLANVANRAAWYFPTSAFSGVKVKIPVDVDLESLNLHSLIPPGAQQNYLTCCNNIELIHHEEAGLSKADAILLWDKNCLLKPCIWPYLGKTAIVDPLFYASVECGTYQGFFNETIKQGQQERFIELSKRNYSELLKQVSSYDKGYVFGTGPSLDRAFEFNFGNGFRVVCNSIVKNKELLNHIKPHLLVFADPVFHFSPCMYSAEFRRLMREAVDEYQCYVMVPDISVPLLVAHFPDLKGKIIGMPRRGKKLNFPGENDFFVPVTRNILTMLMLPVASSVAREIYIIGADGRKPDENYFWKHSFSSQFGNLMQTAFDTHPSFFRDRVYKDYYKEHCKVLEGLINYGESMGITYHTLTPSYIKVLAQRQL